MFVCKKNFEMQSIYVKKLFLIRFHLFFQKGFESVDVGDERFTSAFRDGKCRIRLASDKLLAALKVAESFQAARMTCQVAVC